MICFLVQINMDGWIRHGLYPRHLCTPSPVRAQAIKSTQLNSSETLGYWSLVSRTVINHCVAELAVRMRAR